MRPLTQALPLFLAAFLLLSAPAAARRARVRPSSRTSSAAASSSSAEDTSAAAPDQDTNPQQLRYYAAQPVDDAEDAQQGGVVLVSSDAYNGPYGRPTARAQTDVSEAQLRAQLLSSRAYSAAAAPRPRVKEQAKQPPVQTIRNYSKVNDDGSFTFGYEAADGSFKEETRGTDCVVRGKYGYIDPDGNKREFTYVSGNPCDPNAVNEEEEEPVADSGEENIPKSPVRPLRPLRPTASSATLAPRPTTTVFQQDYRAQDEDDALDNAPQSLFTPTPRPRYVQPTPAPAIYTQTLEARPQAAVRITPRPPVAPTTPRSQLPATTYRPQLLQLAVTPRPNIAYAKQQIPRPTALPSAYSPSSTAAIDFDEELRKFQIENNVLTTPSPVRTKPQQQTTQQVLRPVAPQPVRAQTLPQSRPQKAPSSDPIYTSELVYDPSTGQYNTVLYQQLPQTTGEVNLRHRLQPYVAPVQLPQQQYYQQQQSQLLAQSQQLFAAQQQQRALAQQQQNRYLQAQQAAHSQLQTTTPRVPQRFAASASAQPQPQYYYVTPNGAGVPGRDHLAQGQIEAFLRGHNIAF